ncbi:MAG: hypothetical protein ACK5N0_08930 [Synechococcaceae cyanobacterium]
MANTLESNEDFRPEIDQLCDLKLYQNMTNLSHVEYALMAVSLKLHKLVSKKLKAIEYSEASLHYLDMREYEDFRNGYIATRLRAILGYDAYEDMGSEITRSKCDQLISKFQL